MQGRNFIVRAILGLDVYYMGNRFTTTGYLIKTILKSAPFHNLLIAPI